MADAMSEVKPSTEYSGSSDSQTQRMSTSSNGSQTLTRHASGRRYFKSEALRHHFIAMMGEFVGTFLFLFVAYASVQVIQKNSPPSGIDNAGLLYIATAFGLSLVVNVWIFYRVSGGVLNPAVTLSFVIYGAMSWQRGTLLIIAQFLGGMSAGGVVKALLPGPVLFANSLAHGISRTQGLFLEFFMTSQLIITIFLLAAEKHRATFIAPLAIGFSLWLGHLVNVYWTGAGLNPARSLGAAVALLEFPDYFWIYMLGPFMSSFASAGFYWFLKFIEYETANPEQDSDRVKAVIQSIDNDDMVENAYMRRSRAQQSPV